MVKKTSTTAITKSTNRPWEKWIELLNEASAASKTHPEIAAIALEYMPDECTNKEWWAQGVAIAYEQHVGQRTPGQSSAGDFQLSATETVNGDKDDALSQWVELMTEKTEVVGIPFDSGPAVTASEKWRYWKVKMADGSKVTVNITDKPHGRSTLSVNHSRLSTSEDIDRLKPLWRELLNYLD